MSLLYIAIYEPKGWTSELSVPSVYYKYDKATREAVTTTTTKPFQISSDHWSSSLSRPEPGHCQEQGMKMKSSCLCSWKVPG